jgi:hypothetical protein
MCVQSGNVYLIKFGREVYNADLFEVIQFQARKLIFKENDVRIQLTIHSSLSIRVIKEIILAKLKIKSAWIKFMLNEKLFSDRSRIYDIPIYREGNAGQGGNLCQAF